jgi:glyoxylase-like metal-dependent hydrolase (beta-lactamase superfamily II)
MFQLARGVINERITVAGNEIYPGYLIRGDEKTVMIDAGVNLMGPLYVRSLGKILGAGGRPDYLFVTHSHYDHLGAALYLKERMPGIILGAHARVNDILQKESALAVMNRLSENHRALFKDIPDEPDLLIRPFQFDLALAGGDRFDCGGLVCEVIEVPGHTRDSLAYYVPELKALFPGEAAGVPERGGTTVQVEFLSSYEDYVASLEKMMALVPEMIGIGHGMVVTGGDARSFLERSYRATFEYRALLERYLNEAGGSVDRAIESVVMKEYDERGAILQERNAYITNVSAQVRHIASLGHGRAD